MAWKRVAIAAVLLAAVSCSTSASSTIESEQPSDGIEDQTILWTESGISDYLVTVTDRDNTPTGGCIWITEVHDSSVDVRWIANFDGDCDDWDVSPPALHERIDELQADAETSGADLTVEWGDNGVPTSIDFTPNNTDFEELAVTIEFQDLTGSSSVRTDLATARNDWSASDIDSYQLVLTEGRNPWSNGCQWTTTVSSGAVADVVLDPTSTSSYCSEGEGTTVEELHRLISRWADTIDQFSDPVWGEHTLNVEFSETGVPTSIEYDLANGQDEESSLTIAFTPLG